MLRRKTLLYFLRVAVTLGAIALAFSQVDMGKMWPLLARLPLLVILGTLLAIHLGQFFSAQRTRLYLAGQGIILPMVPSLKLHYIGGLYNVFLPGGAGGDVYKAWWLKKHAQGKLGSMVKVMLASRLNGLWALGVVLCALAAFSAPLREAFPEASWLAWAAIPVGTLFYSLAARLLLREPVKQQAQAAPYSLGVQSLLVVAAYLLAQGIGITEHRLEYVILFMLSCMLAMLPISIGGIGVRELAVLHGTQLLGLSQENGVALAFSFTVLNLTIPIAGAVVQHIFALEGQPRGVVL